MKQTKKPGFALWAACVLLCLVLISAHFTSGLYAKFIVNTATSDDGRAASFQASASMKDQDGSYELTFVNDSEVSVRYSVTVLPNEPEMFSDITLDGESGSAPDENGAVTFLNAGTLARGATGHADLTLTVNQAYVDPDAASLLLDFSNDSITTAETTLPFTVTVSFTQID